MRMVLANLWLTKPLLLRQLAQFRSTDAAIRTTTAVTIIEGGMTENVLPATARAVVNYRLLPGDTIQAVTERTRKMIYDERITLVPTRPPNESPPPSSVDSPAFFALHKTIKQVFPDVIFAPAMMLGGSDSHHSSVVADDIYGFSPLRMMQDDMERIHGPNERISMEDFRKMIAFYMMLIEDASS
jgi:carboxypeptidase PM20D1